MNPPIYKNLYLWDKLWPLCNWPIIYSLQEEERFKTHRLWSQRSLAFIFPFLLPTFVILGNLLLHPANLQGPTVANGDTNIYLLALLQRFSKVTYVECLAYHGHPVNESHHRTKLQGESPKATFRK